MDWKCGLPLDYYEFIVIMKYYEYIIPPVLTFSTSLMEHHPESQGIFHLQQITQSRALVNVPFSGDLGHGFLDMTFNCLEMKDPPF